MTTESIAALLAFPVAYTHIFKATSYRTQNMATAFAVISELKDVFSEDIRMSSVVQFHVLQPNSIIKQAADHHDIFLEIITLIKLSSTNLSSSCWCQNSVRLFCKVHKDIKADILTTENAESRCPPNFAAYS